MKNIPKLDQSTLRILFTRHKAYLLPVGVCLLSLIIFMQFTLQQLQGVFHARDEERILHERNTLLKQNIAVVSAISDDTLDQQAAVVAAALPAEKDFSGIITALSEAAGKAGVGLGDYAFQVGDLSNQQTNQTLVAQPFIEVNLLINGGIDGVRNFTKELTQRLPLSEVISTQLTKTDATVKVFFYYKPEVPAKAVTNGEAIKGFSQKEIELINTLATWDNN